MKKIIAVEKAFYKGNIVKVGEIIEITDDKKVPEWAKVLEQAKSVQDEPLVAQGTLIHEEGTTKEETKDVQDELVGKTDEELELILDELLTKALDKNIFIEDADKKTVIEQINELKSKLAEVEGAEA